MVDKSHMHVVGCLAGWLACILSCPSRPPRLIQKLEWATGGVLACWLMVKLILPARQQVAQELVKQIWVVHQGLFRGLQQIMRTARGLAKGMFQETFQELLT